MALNDHQILQIIQMRSLGYTQQEIADCLGVSRKTVENRLRRLRSESEKIEEKGGSLENFFWGTLLNLGAAEVLLGILNNGYGGKS